MEKQHADVWDSGVVSDDNTVLIHYEGPELNPVTRYYFTVECETAAGEKLCSPAGTFVTGKLNEKWHAKWISYDKVTRDFVAGQYLRKEFEIKGEVASAFLSICGLGYFESFINGVKTGDDILSPAFTRYDAECYYMQYDVAELLKQGENAIGVSLGNGFYYGFTQDAWNTTAATWRNPPKMIW